MANATQQLDEIREIVADVLEIEVEELEDRADFSEVYGADSLRAIEVVARIEKLYRIEIPQAELADARNMEALYGIVCRYAGWS